MCLPEALKDQSFAAVLQSEDAVMRWLAALLKNLSSNGPVAPGAQDQSSSDNPSASPLDDPGNSRPAIPMQQLVSMGGAPPSSFALPTGSSTWQNVAGGTGL